MSTTFLFEAGAAAPAILTVSRTHAVRVELTLYVDLRTTGASGELTPIPVGWRIVEP